jgi:predicted transcriptional regulator
MNGFFIVFSGESRSGFLKNLKKFYKTINYEILRNLNYETIRNKKINSQMTTKVLKPTEAELEILQLLWEKGPSLVRTINDELNKNREVGYTTTLKMMQIMAEKGLLTRSKEGRGHVYSPAIQQDDTRQQFLDRLLHGVFSGSASNLVMQILGNHKTSEEELKEIKDYITKLEGENV